MKDCKERRNFILGNYLLEMLCFHGRMCLKSEPQKLNFVMGKVILKTSQKRLKTRL